MLAARYSPAAMDCKEDSMHSVWFGEYLGTLVLILLGNGVNANVTLRKSYAADAGWMVVATGWAIAVLCGVLVAQAFGSPGAHLNPAISLASAVISGDYSHLLSFWSAQLLGAMSGSALMALHFAPHWRPSTDPAPNSASSVPVRPSAARSLTLPAKSSAQWCWLSWQAPSSRTEFLRPAQPLESDRGS